MKYLFLDSFAYISPCMLASALYDMTKNKDRLERLCTIFEGASVTAREEKRCGMEAEFLQLDYQVQSTHVKTHDLMNLCEKLDTNEKTKEKLKEYITIDAEAISMDPSDALFESKAAFDSLVFVAYIFETISSLGVGTVYVPEVIVPSAEFSSPAMSQKVSNAIYIFKKHGISPVSSHICAPSFSQGWAAMCVCLGISPKVSHTGSIIKIGYGAGEDNIDDVPNILRAVYGEEGEEDMLFEAEMALNPSFYFSKATVLSEA